MAAPNFENDQPVYTFRKCLLNSFVCEALWSKKNKRNRKLSPDFRDLLKKCRNLVIY